MSFVFRQGMLLPKERPSWLSYVCLFESMFILFAWREAKKGAFASSRACAYGACFYGRRGGRFYCSTSIFVLVGDEWLFLGER